MEFALAVDPTAHPVIAGTSVRKARWGRSGMGKRGGMRVTYYYAISREAGVLIMAFAKNEKENRTSDDKRTINNLIDAIQAEI